MSTEKPNDKTETQNPVESSALLGQLTALHSFLLLLVMITVCLLAAGQWRLMKRWNALEQVIVSPAPPATASNQTMHPRSQ